MQPCQRRTIGGTEGRGGRVILATHPSSTHLCLSSALHLIPFPVYAVIARPGGDIGVRMDRHKGMRLFASPSPFLSIYLSISSNPLSLATTCTHTRARAYTLSLSLSVAMIIRLCPACRHIRRVYDSVPLSRQCLPTPGFIQRRSDRALFGSPSFFGRRGKRFMGGG